MERYTVKTLRAGQPRPYADSEYEYLVTVERTDWRDENSTKFEPWLMYGDVEVRIRKEESDRKAGRLYGGDTPDELRKMQRDWAKGIVRTLCHGFRERGDQDGIAEGSMEAHFAATLKSLTINPAKGEIRALIVQAYTD